MKSRNRKIYERDDGICQLCLEPVGRNSRGYRQGQTFTADHIIPASWGAPDALWNMRSAHGICNLRRANRIDMNIDQEALAKNIYIVMGGTWEDRMASAAQLIAAYREYKPLLEEHKKTGVDISERIPPIVRMIQSGVFPWG